MSRHRSPRGRHGETTCVVDPGASLPEQRGSGHLTEPRPARQLDTPRLPRPRLASSGQLAVAELRPRFSGAADFEAALGLAPVTERDPALLVGVENDDRPATLAGQAPLTSDAPLDKHPDVAFEMATGWRPDGTLPAPADPSPAEATLDDWLAGQGSVDGANLDVPSLEGGRPPTAFEWPAPRRGASPHGWKSVGAFGLPQPASDAASGSASGPTNASASGPTNASASGPTNASASRPTNASASRPEQVWWELGAVLDEPGVPDGEPPAAADTGSSEDRPETSYPADPFAPPAAFRTAAEVDLAAAADVDLAAAFEPLAGTTDVVDETETTTVLASRAATRRHRRGAARPGLHRLGQRSSGPVIALAVAGVIVVIAGVTALVGFGKSLWSTPRPDTETQAAAPAPALTPPPAPTPVEGPGAPAKKQTEAPKNAAPNTEAAPDAVLSQANCAKRVSDPASLGQALAAATPGQKICATGNMSGSRLRVTRSGTPSAPISVIGNGSTPVKGITIEASNVIVGGFSMTNPQAPGIELTGNDITVRNNTVKHPTGGDYDGLRFFGTNLKILNNTITDINPDGTGAHADCMQTFATDSRSPASQNVVIDGNRCERIDNQCLIAEGPNSSAGDGSGQGRSANITFTDNFCQVGASQAVQIDDVQGVRVSGNTITGTPDKAFSFQNNATGAVVTANKIAAGIGYQVGMDASSRPGYQGPAVGGAP